MCERGSVGVRCHDSPHDEAARPSLRTFHTASPRTPVNSPQPTLRSGGYSQRPEVFSNQGQPPQLGEHAVHVRFATPPLVAHTAAQNRSNSEEPQAAEAQVISPELSTQAHST